jgi:hypothetical protein
MLDFRSIVHEKLFLEEEEIASPPTSTASDAEITFFKKINTANSSIPQKQEDVRKFVQTLLSKQSDYQAVKDFIPYEDYLPIIDIIYTSLGSKAGFLASKSPDGTLDKLWNNVNAALDANPTILNKLKNKNIDTYVYQDTVIEGMAKNILDFKNKSLIAAAAYQTIGPMFIVPALESIFEKRLSVETQLKISGNKTGYVTPDIYRSFIQDIFTHYTEYSTGGKKVDDKILSGLTEAGINYQALIYIAISTIKFYNNLLVDLLTKSFAEDDPKQDIIGKYLEKELVDNTNAKKYAFQLALTGKFNSDFGVKTSDIEKSPAGKQQFPASPTPTPTA